MKKRLFVILFIVFFLAVACDEKEVFLFRDGHEIYFDKFFVNAMPPGTEAADSTVVSFFLYPDHTQDIKAPLTVHLSGKLPVEDLKFRLRVIAEETTAKPDEYTLDEEYVFHARPVAGNAVSISDTIYIGFHRSARVSELAKGVRLVVELVPGENLQLGQVERIRATLILTTATIKPDWWDEEVEENLLGVYTQKKYKYFLNQVDLAAEMNAQLIRERPDRAIQLAFQFKAWLAAQNPPILEEGGSAMQVAL